MAPEAPGSLVVVDSRIHNQELVGFSETVEYAPDQTQQIEASGGWFFVL